jgi:hypothetical protein
MILRERGDEEGYSVWKRPGRVIGELESSLAGWVNELTLLRTPAEHPARIGGAVRCKIVQDHAMF